MKFYKSVVTSRLVVFRTRFGEPTKFLHMTKQKWLNLDRPETITMKGHSND